MSTCRWPAWRLLMLLCVWVLGGLVPRAYGGTLAVVAGVLVCVVVAGVWTWEVEGE